MESTLHGSWGKKVYEIDAAGNIVGEDFDQEVAPVAGQDVQLSIDLDVQQYAEQALQTELRNQQNLPYGPSENHGGVAGGGQMAHNPIDPTTNFKTRVFASSKEWGTVEWIPFKAPAGAVVVEDYSNGQIIAMASYPTFDNRWRRPASARQVRPAVPQERRPGQVDPRQPRDPGSVQHGLVDQAVRRRRGDRRGIITPTSGTSTRASTRSTRSTRRSARTGVRCQFKNALVRTNRPRCTGRCRCRRALAVSSDVFFYRIGEKFYEMAEHDDVRSGGPVVHEGRSSSRSASAPRPASSSRPSTGPRARHADQGRDRHRQVRQERGTPAGVGDDVQVAIGQGLLSATPLQAVNAYSTLANGGSRMKPSIIKAIYAPLPGPHARGRRPRQGHRRAVVRDADGARTS